MTPKERENPQILNASRKRRIAAGCGQEVVDVNRLLKQYELLHELMKRMTGKGKRGFGMNPAALGLGGNPKQGAKLHGFGRKKRFR